MILLSIDVGIRNLAYILIQHHDVDRHEILKWDVIELIEPHETASKVQNTYIGKSLCKQFDDILPGYDIDKVIIENQIGQNAIKMKAIQGMINMYFIMREYDIENILNYNACHKLKPFIDKNKKTTYSERKKLSKTITLALCQKYYDDDILDFYKSFKKKDDLADCLLQGLDYLKKQDKLTSEFYETMKTFYCEMS
jgi:hypothetical protein